MTHGALHASTGNLDKATDPEDNRIMAICALVALDNLISLDAKSLNHGDLIERLQRIAQGKQEPNTRRTTWASHSLNRQAEPCRQRRF